MNARIKQQGGWAGSFVIVGVLLAGLLVGGVYFLKSYQFRGDDFAVNTSDEKASDERDKSSDNSSNNQDDTGRSTDKTTPDSDTQDQGKSSEDQALPETGPADTVAHMAVLGLVTYSGVAYARSRRHITL